MSQLLDRVSTKRLMAYSAAAGMGAFAFGQSTDAATQVNMSLFGTTFQHAGTAATNSDYAVGINLDGDLGGVVDVNLGINLNAISFSPIVGNPVFSSSTSGGLSYYVNGFSTGATVDGSTDTAGGGGNFSFVTPFVNLYGGYRYQIHHTANLDWVGLRFKIGGVNHFGAIQVLSQDGLGPLDTSGDGIINNLGDNSPDPVRITIGAMIWNDTPGVGVVVPEPASLGLLAMGAGAIGLRRRQA